MSTPGGHGADWGDETTTRWVNTPHSATAEVEDLTASYKVENVLHAEHLYYSTVFVVYGLFRYLQLIHQKKGGGDPSRTVLTDPPTLICVFCWFLVVVWALYSTSTTGA